MARDYILDSTFDKETGVSTVTLQTKWGTFTNVVVCHDEDKDVMNRWDGCTFAHYKCVADKYAAKARAFHERALGMDHAANVLWQAKNQMDRDKGVWDYRDDSIIELRCLAESAEKEAAQYREKAKQMRADYKNFCADTITAHRDFRKRASEKFDNKTKKAIEESQKE